MNQREVMGNSIEYSLSNTLLKLFCFFLLPLYTRLFNLEEIGIVELIISFSNIANYMITFCMFSKIMGLANKYQNDKQKVERLFGSVFMLIIIMGMIVITLLVIFSNTIGTMILGGGEYYNTLLIGVIAYVFGCVNFVYEYRLKSINGNKKLYICNIFYFVVLLFLNITFAVILKLGIQGVLFAYLIVNIGLCIYMLIDLVKNKLIIICMDKTLLIEVLKHTKSYVVSNIVLTTRNFVSRRFLLASCGIAMVGVYSVASRFGTIIELILFTFNSIFFSYLYTKLDKNEKKFKEKINRCVNLLIYAYGAILIIIGLFAQEIIIVLMEEAYIKVWSVIPYLAIIGAIKMGYYIYLNIFLYYKIQIKKMAATIFFSSCISMICLYYLLPMYEIYGAVISEIIGITICTIILIRMVIKQENELIFLDRIIGKIIIIIGFIVGGLVPTYIKYPTIVSRFNIAYKLVVLLVYICVCILNMKVEIKDILKNIKNKKIYKRMKKIYLNKGISEKIVFICNDGENYGGDSKAIINMVNIECKRYEVVLLLKNIDKKKKDIPSMVRCVKFGSKQAYREMATAKVWVSDSVLEPGIYKGRKQKYIYTGKGDRYLKKIHLDIGEENIVHESMSCDLMISGSEFGRKVCKSAYGYKGEIYNFGCPRNDKLVNMEAKDIDVMRKKLNVGNKKILLYVISIINFEDAMLDIAKVINTLEEKDKCQWIAYICIENEQYSKELVGKIKNSSEKIIDMTKYEDMSDLLLVADCFVTDYSYYAGDYILTKKAIVLYQPDCYKAIVGDKDVYNDIQELPYMVGKNTEEISEIFKYLDEEKARKNCLSIMRFYDTVETGFATKKIVEYINRLDFEDSEVFYN